MRNKWENEKHEGEVLKMRLDIQKSEIGQWKQRMETREKEYK